MLLSKLSLFALSLAILTVLGNTRVATATPSSTAAPNSFRSQADDAFTKLKSLEGKWSMSQDGSNPIITYTPASDGTALMEQFGDMVSIYHKDGDSILMTHYCSLGNQPRVRSTRFDQSEKMTFDFVDISNLSPGGMYINGVTIEWKDANHIIETWSSVNGSGKQEAEVFELYRAKN